MESPGASYEDQGAEQLMIVTVMRRKERLQELLEQLSRRHPEENVAKGGSWLVVGSPRHDNVFDCWGSRKDGAENLEVH
jgi:hypothetical protein